MKDRLTYATFLFLSCLIGIRQLDAAVVLNTPETWASGLADWTNATPTGTQNSTLSNPGGYLGIRFGAQGGQPAYEEDTIYSSAARFTGSYQTNLPLALRFNFYAEDVLPLSSVLYLHSAVSGETWEYAFTASGTGSWLLQDVVFDYSYGGWVGWGSASDFWNDLANIDWIGVNIARKLDTMQQDYGIDNWEYYVVIPEPGTMSILATAFISLAFAFRKKLRLQLAAVNKT